MRPLPLVLLGVAALGGCARADHADLSRFAEAVDKVHAQADVAFTRANAISRQAEIDLFVASRRPGLSERAFPPVVDAETATAWNEALSDLERYGSLLAELTGDGRGARTQSALGALGHELQTERAQARISPGIGAGFAALAGALVDASARSSAKSIMRDTDPAVRRLVTAMAGAIGADRTEGLQGTVWSSWTTSLNGTRNAYALAAEKGDEARQRALVSDFLGAVDRRDADLRTLGSLRVSLLALADAHSAAAAGSAPSQAAVIAGIDRRLADAMRDIRTLGGDEKK